MVLIFLNTKENKYTKISNQKTVAIALIFLFLRRLLCVSRNIRIFSAFQNAALYRNPCFYQKNIEDISCVLF